MKIATKLCQRINLSIHEIIKVLALQKKAKQFNNFQHFETIALFLYVLLYTALQPGPFGFISVPSPLH